MNKSSDSRNTCREQRSSSLYRNIALLCLAILALALGLVGCSFSDSRNEAVITAVSTTALSGKVSFSTSADLTAMKMKPDSIAVNILVQSPQLSSSLTLSTDGSGRFRSSELKAGEYLLTFSSATASSIKRLGEVSVIIYPEDITCCLVTLTGQDTRDLDRDGITAEMQLTAQIFADNNEDLASDGAYYRTVTAAGASTTVFANGKNVYNDGRGTTTIKRLDQADESFADRDGDEIPDSTDTDDDNDGILDINDDDINNNGISDSIEGEVPNKYAPVLSISVVKGSTGDITVLYKVTDMDDEACNIQVEYRGGTTGTIWTAANFSGDIANISPGDTLRTLIWHSALDQPHMMDNNFQLRLTPTGIDGHQGLAVISDSFFLDNVETNTAPAVKITRPVAGTLLTGTDLITWSATDIDPGDLIQRLWLYYSLNDGDWNRITIVEGNPGFYDWDTSALINSTRYRLKIEAYDGEDTTTVISSDYFSISNSGSNMFPSISNVAFQGSAGDITITYDLTDSDGDSCSIKTEYRSTATGSLWVTATTTGTTSLIPPGTGKSILWRTAIDEPLADSAYFQVRITPQDPSTWGAAAESAPILVDNVP